MARVIVVFPKAEDAKNIKNLLVRHGFTVVATCTTGAQAMQYVDQLDDGIVVCGYKFADMMHTELKEYLPPGFEMLLIASRHLWEACANNGIVCLALPIKVYDLISTMEMIDQTIARRRRKQKAKAKTRSREETELIQKAKLLLMERNNMTEEEAHRYIQKCSMDSGTNMVETARMVFSIMDL